MASSHAHTLLAARRSVVHAALVDYARCADWLTIHGGWPDAPPRPLEVGTRFRQRLSLLGGCDIWTFTITELSSEQLVFTGKGTLGGRAELRFRLRDAGGGTSVRSELWASGLLPGPVAGKVTSLLVSELDHSLRRLDAEIAGGDPDAVAPPSMPPGVSLIAKIIARTALRSA